MSITVFILGFIIASFIYDYLIKVPITLLLIRYQDRKILKELQKLQTENQLGLYDAIEKTMQQTKQH